MSRSRGRSRTPTSSRRWPRTSSRRCRRRTSSLRSRTSANRRSRWSPGQPGRSGRPTRHHRDRGSSSCSTCRCASRRTACGTRAAGCSSPRSGRCRGHRSGDRPAATCRRAVRRSTATRSRRRWSAATSLIRRRRRERRRHHVAELAGRRVQLVRATRQVDHQLIHAGAVEQQHLGQRHRVGERLEPARVGVERLAVGERLVRVVRREAEVGIEFGAVAGLEQLDGADDRQVDRLATISPSRPTERGRSTSRVGRVLSSTIRQRRSVRRSSWLEWTYGRRGRRRASDVSEGHSDAALHVSAAERHSSWSRRHTAPNRSSPRCPPSRPEWQAAVSSAVGLRSSAWLRPHRAQLSSSYSGPPLRKRRRCRS